jgi:GPH family glycoside/pentoside/hexuronide:cation symporter
VRVASWQTVVSTGGYVLTFVVAPMLFSRFGVRGAALMLLPSFITFIGPILVIKEDATNVASATSQIEKQVPLWDSLKMTLTNKTFMIYMSSVATFFFGLQFFLGGIAFIAADMMGITDTNLGLMNAAAFAPVPVMLIVFNLISRKKGAKYAFRAALLVFAVSMLMYPLGWQKLNLPVPPIMVGIIAGLIASFSIGAFFTIPYAFPAHIAAVEAKETGKNRAGMFFAVQPAPCWRFCSPGSMEWSLSALSWQSQWCWRSSFSPPTRWESPPPRPLKIPDRSYLTIAPCRNCRERFI